MVLGRYSFALITLPTLDDETWLSSRLCSAAFGCVGVNNGTLCSPSLFKASSISRSVLSNSAIASSDSSISLTTWSSTFSSFDALSMSTICVSSSFIVFTLSLSVARLCLSHTTSLSGLSVLTLAIASTVFVTSLVADALWPPLTRFFLDRSSMPTFQPSRTLRKYKRFSNRLWHANAQQIRREQDHFVAEPNKISATLVH